MVTKIILWGNLVGRVGWDEKRQLAFFEYDNTFKNAGLEISPIAMPLEKTQGNKIFSFPGLNPQTFLGLPGLLADALPDRYGNALINAWLARQGRDPQSVNPLDRLCFVGSRGMGALEFEPAKEPFKEKSETLNTEELMQIAKELLEDKKKLGSNLSHDKTMAMKSIIRVGTSAGGARAKAIVAYNEKTGEVRSGQLPVDADFEHWIVKFDGVNNLVLGDPVGYGRIEFAYYKMAIACGIEMTKCKLLEENGRAHFMTKRFDREQNNRMHMQSLCGMAHFDYNDPLGYSYEQAFQIMRQLRLSYENAEQLFLRMVFNVMARNQDDHTKNIAFLMNQKGVWKLSPAFDVIYAFNPNGGWTKQHQMSIQGKHNNIVLSDILLLAKTMNIKKPMQYIERVKDALNDWKKFANEAGIPSKQIAEIKKNFWGL